MFQVPIFRPTLEEFSNFGKYIQYMELCGAHNQGIARVSTIFFLFFCVVKTVKIVEIVKICETHFSLFISVESSPIWSI